MGPGGKAVDAQGVSVSAASTPEGAGDVAEREALPLRLSVARGGLGLELCAPLGFGPLVVEELEVSLPGVTYPVDLSRGVKHFRNRRSLLRHAVVRIDLELLSVAWAKVLAASFGSSVRVRLRPISESPGGASGNDTLRTTALAVCIHAQKVALAFDLVLTSGIEPRLVVDSPRMIGREESPLLLAIQCLDAGLQAATGETLNLTRKGRSMTLSGLCEAVTLLVLPGMGCRLPSVVGQVITEVQNDSRGLCLTLGTRQTPYPSGARGLRLGGASDFLERADESLISGDFAGARARYMDALEKAPGHEEALFELAALDLSLLDRAESALSFIEELEGVVASQKSSEVTSRHRIALARALARTGRRDAAREALDSAAGIESDSVLAALLYDELTHAVDSPELARNYADRGVARAPFLAAPRMRRFTLALASGDLKTARADAEQLEAGQVDDAERALQCLEVGRAFLAQGHADLAQSWLRRALRLVPDDPTIMVELAKCLLDSGERLRGAELLQSALRQATRKNESGNDGPFGDPTPVDASETNRVLVNEARMLLGRLCMEDGRKSDALSYLAAIETRSFVGLDARLLEAEIFHAMDRKERRDRALTRVLEAIELGWAQPGQHQARLERLLRLSVEDAGDPALAAFARRVLETADEVAPE